MWPRRAPRPPRPHVCAGRLCFAFDEGYFEAKGGGLRLPYPVPFRLLGKEAEGWIQTGYISERVRVSRGNKGTVFALRRVS